MSTQRNTLIAKAVRFALIGGAAIAAAVPAYAAEEGEGEEKAQRIEVTGSRIKRSDVEGALPVTVIDREQIDTSGYTSVSDLLRNTTFNSFGSFRPQSGSSAQSFSELSLRGLGGGRTLILIDGRRAPVSPDTGSAQDLNAIPLGAVERIEILSDGASAIYGTDAIGGVVNVITRKDFSGVELKYGESRPSREGGDTDEMHVLMGAAGDKGSLIVGFSSNEREIVFQRDRPWSTGGASTFSNNLFTAIAAPGTLYGFRAGGFVANPTYGSVLPGTCSGAAFPDFFISGSGSSQRCFYDFTAQAADEANIETSSLFTRGEYEINDDWTAYMTATVSRAESFGRYAPVPSSPWPGGSIFLPVGSPNHPAVVAPGAGYDPTVPYFMRHRFAALGPRDTTTDKNTYDTLIGFEGMIGDVTVDVGARLTEAKFYELGRNYVVGGLAQQLISNGTYNVYDPFNVDRDILDSMIATITRDSVSRITEYYANASFDLFELGGGVASMAVGAETRKEVYEDIYDTLQSSGQIVGSAGNSSFGGRTVDAFYFEMLLPFFDGFETSIAARYDSYSDYGSDTSPKISFRYQPIDELTLRASFGQGFRAPALSDVTAQPAFSADTVTHAPTCIAFGLAPTCSVQVTAYALANPNLTSEQSDQFSAGLAWQPTEWLNMTLDYFNIEVEGRVAAISTGRLISCLSGASSNCPSGLSLLPTNVNPPVPSNGLGVAFGSAGEVLYAQRGSVNLGTLESSGLDLNFETNFDFAEAGRLKNMLTITYMDEFSVDGGANIVGDPSAPEIRAILANEWVISDFSVVWNINYIDGTLSTAGTEARAGNNDYGYSHTLPSWTTHNLQVNWNTPWNGRLTVGVNNLTDEDPVLDPFDPTGRGFDFNLYDGYGRVPYVRYTQTF
ncbi:TonB-dependent receptor [Permianibacter aggregans]|uniref:Iron complex outermembrane receptor protein n=1 Tax=Permianibacter aggregans TaxID=1510150 RepID=A0A4R6UJ16_9GAMM|nr:TonB-dependent receptor [Permianibacter aggregans]TDQ46811.1 iron complex outermembrane receptor protein [Permianibacter aggregans]